MNVLGNDEIAELCENINYMSMDIKESFEHKRQMENEKSEIITSISHELRAPVTTIIEYLYILKNKHYESKEEEQEYLSAAYNLSMKLKKLIRNYSISNRCEGAIGYGIINNITIVAGESICSNSDQNDMLLEFINFVSKLSF